MEGTVQGHQMLPLQYGMRVGAAPLMTGAEWSRPATDDCPTGGPPSEPVASMCRGAPVGPGDGAWRCGLKARSTHCIRARRGVLSERVWGEVAALPGDARGDHRTLVPNRGQ